MQKMTHRWYIVIAAKSGITLVAERNQKSRRKSETKGGNQKSSGKSELDRMFIKSTKVDDTRITSISCTLPAHQNQSSEARNNLFNSIQI